MRTLRVGTEFSCMPCVPQAATTATNGTMAGVSMRHKRAQSSMIVIYALFVERRRRPSRQADGVIGRGGKGKRRERWDGVEWNWM